MVQQTQRTDTFRSFNLTEIKLSHDPNIFYEVMIAELPNVGKTGQKFTLGKNLGCLVG